MELADDIAYAVHDLEDAIATEVLTLADWQIIMPLCNYKSLTLHG